MARLSNIEFAYEIIRIVMLNPGATREQVEDITGFDKDTVNNHLRTAVFSGLMYRRRESRRDRFKYHMQATPYGEWSST